MPKRLDISRRDFLGGVALSTAAGALSPLQALAQKKAAGSAYPPDLMGLRGSQPGSFDVAHAVAREGKRYASPRELSEKPYDLIVVGGGISGLAAAFFYRQRMGPAARMLILDNHDDFGGHARRNEFNVDGRRLIGYGGSQSIDTPGAYSPPSAALLRDLGIFTERFYAYFDRDLFQRAGLSRGVYFSREAYGRDLTAPALDVSGHADAAAANARLLERYPLDPLARRALLALLGSEHNYLSATPREQRRELLRSMSYRDFLLQHARVPEAVYYLFRDNMLGWWGVGWDAISALNAARMKMPGTRHLDVPQLERSARDRDEPYIFHFPDGNAGVARALVRQLIPGALPGSTMEDMVLNRVDYSLLDQSASACRLRLDSTAVDVRHTANESAVDVSYVRHGSVHRVRGKHAVLACYNAIIPHICSELPQDQRAAIAYATKVPLVYVSAAVRNWRPFAQLGLHAVSVPQPAFMNSFGLDFPVSMGGYNFAADPGQPTVLHGTHVPTVPDQGLDAKAQHRLGRRALYEATYAQLESAIVRQLDGALGGAGFDPERDLAGLTVNRWPHGYAYEYNDLSDPADYGRDKGPHLLGARQLGRISIANSDASAYAFVDGAIDAAWRAVGEQVN